MQPSVTRLGAVIEHVLGVARETLGPSGWVVVDGVLLQGIASPLVMAVGVGNPDQVAHADVDVTEWDLQGRRREAGTIRCQLSAAAADARDPAPSRGDVLAALGALDLALRGQVPADVADRIVVGGQRWDHLTDESRSALWTTCYVDVVWTAWL